MPYGAGSGSAFAELKACTPASLSPSNGVIGLLTPRQKSSASWSANQTPMRFRSTRCRLPLTSVDEKASWTISLRFVVGVPLVVRAEVADVLGRSERRPRLLEQEHGVVAVRRQAAGRDLEPVEAVLLGLSVTFTLSCAFGMQAAAVPTKA